MRDHVAGDAHGVDRATDLAEITIRVSAGAFDCDAVAVRANGAAKNATDFGVVNSKEAINLMGGNEMLGSANIA